MADNTTDQSQAMKAKSDAYNAELAKVNYYKTTLAYGLGIAGNVAGILIAIKRKSGFLGGVGWFLLIGAAGTAAGFIAGSVLDGRPK
jgi:hypothetical protein